MNVIFYGERGFSWGFLWGTRLFNPHFNHRFRDLFMEIPQKYPQTPLLHKDHITEEVDEKVKQTLRKHILGEFKGLALRGYY